MSTEGSSSNNNLSASKCTGDCRKIFIPPRSNCPKCGKPTENYESAKQGRLLTYTVLQTVPEGFETPLILGIVEFTNGAKLICLGKCEENELELEKNVIVDCEGGKYYFY